MAARESDIPWPALARRVCDHVVTPFLGAGVSRPPLPNSLELAEKLIAKYEQNEGKRYPFSRSRDLMQVAQYWATMVDNLEPKTAVQDIFEAISEPKFDDQQPHVMLAKLNCPVYLTTNYDDFMERALRRENREPMTEVCRWSTGLSGRKSYLSALEPTVEKPVVFHIHGEISDPESMVLTEDDYLDFMVNVRRVTTSETSLLALPPKIDELLTRTSLLFVGYGLRDWNLRVLLRALVENADTSSKKMGVSVQVEPERDDVAEQHLEEAIKFLEKYFKQPNLSVYWGTADDFLSKLEQRRARFVRERQLSTR
jgi:hypothetical protein